MESGRAEGRRMCDGVDNRLVVERRAANSGRSLMVLAGLVEHGVRMVSQAGSAIGGRAT